MRQLINAIGAGCLLWTVSVQSYGVELTEPVYIEADKVVILDREQKSIYSGNVVLTHGEIRINAVEVTVYGHEKQLKRVEASGSPVKYHQKTAGKKETKAKAKRMEYSVDSGELVLLGEAELWQGGNQFQGDRIVYDTLKDVVRATKAESGTGRVKVIIQPEEKDGGSEPGDTTVSP
jgi:lipopolysaccharide export system protein LptA